MITVIGATGFTGTLITELLNRDRAPMRITGRDRSRLHKLSAALTPIPEIVELDVTNSTQVRTAIAGSKVVINCAGPFTELGIPVVQETLEAGINYLDLTGEQQFISRVIKDFQATALKTGSTAVPACAFEYAIADAVAAFMHENLGELDSFEATYIISGFYTSRGTKRSVVRALASDAYQLKNGSLVKISPGEISRLKYTDGAVYQRFPFPGGEVFLVPLHASVKNISTYLTSQAPPAVLRGMSSIFPVIAGSPLKGLLDLAIDFTDPAPKRTETQFAIYCRGSSSEGTITAQVEGKDPYFLTAKIASRCALAMAEDTDIKKGVISASMVKGDQFIKSIMEEEGVSWTYHVN